MDDSNVKEYAEEIKKELAGLFPNVNNKQDLIDQLWENKYYQTLIKNALEEEELNQKENTQNSTKDTTNKMSSEGSLFNFIRFSTIF